MKMRRGTMLISKQVSYNCAHFIAERDKIIEVRCKRCIAAI